MHLLYFIYIYKIRKTKVQLDVYFKNELPPVLENFLLLFCLEVGTEETGGLQSLGSQRAEHDCGGACVRQVGGDNRTEATEKLG